MRIVDKHGNSHKLTFGRTIYVGDHRVGSLTQSDSVAIMHGFSLPPRLQGLGIGSSIVRHLEIDLHKKHVNTIRVQIPFEECPIHEHFWKKHGYSQDKNMFSKML